MNGPRRRALAGTVLFAAAVAGAVPAAAHGPDPVFSGPLFAQNQELRFRWKAGQEPPAAMQLAINGGAGDANISRNSRAATFTFDPAGTSWINYGLDVGCGVNGLACFSRVNAPTSFTMSFRENGHRFDWGILRWCEMTGRPDGCFDARNSALDEFGHVEILTHHVNFADQSDYTDAVVQTIQRVKPQDGYDAHVLGRCDVASLQRKYDMPNMASKYSTCLDLRTNLTLSGPDWVTYGANVPFTATLTVIDLDAYERLGGNPVSARTVTIQRRLPGAATWSSVGAMVAAAAAGTYTFTAPSQTTTYEWRAVFSKPAGEGLRGDTSPIVSVTVSSCRTAPCPQSAQPDLR
ncbi:MAG TPA: hypothetical protein VGQ58_03175 [Candidatus Limnocylindrales bacterium]|nr:hypothetical protein [Candidatus Limnocylindrales bacterium]